jgi:hypothetical protein
MIASAPALAAALASLAFALPLGAQPQFFESVRTHMPLLRDTSRTVRAADFDRDGDRDLLLGNNEIVGGGQNRLLLNDGKGNFTDVTATHLPVGLWHTHGFAIGDVDRDGDLDFACGDTWQNRLFLNDGAGRFTDATFGRLPVWADETRHLELLDLDGDQDLDLVCANYRQETLFLNDGTGRFTNVTATHMPPDSDSTWNLGAADVDRDGDLDLVFASYGNRRLYLNDGSARFTDATATHLPGTELNSGSAVFADVDRDGDQDLFMGHWMTQGKLYLNDGTGRFADATAGRLPATRPYHWAAVFGDVDGDQDQDLVYTTIYDDQLFLNDGTGRFQEASVARLPQVMSSTIDAIAADLDGDADLDLVTADAGQQARLFFNDGAGAFADATPARLGGPWVGAPAMVLGDLDGDGDLDLVTAGADYGEAVEPEVLMRNDGRGNFTDATAGRLPAPLDDTQALALGDVDRDGDLDLVAGNLRQQSRLYLNDGSAHFTDATATRLPAAADPTTSLALGDVDRDGDLDLVVGNLGAQCRLYLNDGTGTFTDATAARMPAIVRETRALVLGDVDRDGDLDLVLGNGLTRGEVESLFLNDGTGSFTDETQARVPTRFVFPTASLALADVDRDGDLDLVVGNDGVGLGRFNRLYLNDGSGRFSDRELVYDYYRTFALAFADVDVDGDQDAFCGDHDHYDKLYLNDGRGQFSNVSWPRMPATLDRTRSFAVGDVDGDGDPDLVRGSDWNRFTLLVNHHRQIWAPRLAKIGANWSLEVFGQHGYATAAQSAVICFAAAPASIDLPPWGRLGLDPGSLVVLPSLVLPPPAGKAGLQLQVPNLPALVGQTVFVQALVLHTSNFTDARLTNVLAERIVK